MSAPAKVSVITVCLNCRTTIAPTVESVLNQTYGNLEYIVIDGQSIDGTLEYLSTVRGSIHEFLSERDNGIYDAMNKGLSLASGDYIIFMNGGDRFASNDIIKSIFTRQDICEHRPTIISGKALLEYEGRLLNKLWGSRGDSSVCFPHQATFVDSKMHKDNPFDDRLRWVGDFELWQRLKSKGLLKVLYVADVISIFALGGQSNLVDLDARRLAERTYVDSLYSKNFGSLDLFRSAFKILIRRAIRAIFGTSALYKWLYGGFRPDGRQTRGD